MSERGINGLKHANVPGLVEAVIAETIPMHGRMIHGVDDGDFTEESQNYDIHGRVRAELSPPLENDILIQHRPSMPSIEHL